MRGSIPRTPWLNALIVLLTIVAAALTAQLVWGLLSQFSDIILYFVLAGLVAFVLSPLVERVDNQPLPSGVVGLAERLVGRPFAQNLERFRVPRSLAVASFYIALALILIGVIAFLIPPVVQQLSQASQLDFAKRVSDLTPAVQQMLAAIGLRSSDINTARSGAMGSLQNLATLALQNAFAILGAVATLVGNLGLVLLLSFFLTLDGPRLMRKAFDLVPKQYDDDVRMLAVTVDRVFGGYIRSTLLQAFLVGAGTAIVMGIFGEPYVLLASLFAGFFMLIPFVGTALALVPAVLATVSHDPAQAPIIFIILLVYQLLVVNVLMPKLLSDALGLHPLVIIASLLIGVKIGGFWGCAGRKVHPSMLRTMEGVEYNEMIGFDSLPGVASHVPRPLRPTSLAPSRLARAALPSLDSVASTARRPELRFRSDALQARAAARECLAPSATGHPPAPAQPPSLHSPRPPLPLAPRQPA